MRRVFSFYSSSIGKKILMAITGLIFFGFVFGHMLGNLKAFLGPEEFNHYAEGLRSLGAPLLPHGYFLWGVRIFMLAALAIHITMMIQLWLMARSARPVGYQKPVHLEDTYSSRTMRLGGIAIFAYLVYHLLHLTVGSAHPDFVRGDAYHNLVVGMSSVPVAVGYMVAVVIVGFHLHHGVWSMLQTLGLNHPKYNSLRRVFSLAFAIVTVVGFLTIPVGVLTGILQ